MYHCLVLNIDFIFPLHHGIRWHSHVRRPQTNKWDFSFFFIVIGSVRLGCGKTHVKNDDSICSNAMEEQLSRWQCECYVVELLEMIFLNPNKLNYAVKFFVEPWTMNDAPYFFGLPIPWNSTFYSV